MKTRNSNIILTLQKLRKSMKSFTELLAICIQQVGRLLNKLFGSNNPSPENNEDHTSKERSKSPDAAKQCPSISQTTPPKIRCDKVYVSDVNPIFGGSSGRQTKNVIKSSAISKFINKTNQYSCNLSKDYQSNFNQNPDIFRRAKGMCSEYASYGTKHSFISSPFGRR